MIVPHRLAVLACAVVISGCAESHSNTNPEPTNHLTPKSASQSTNDDSRIVTEFTGLNDGPSSPLSATAATSQPLTQLVDDEPVQTTVDQTAKRNADPTNKQGTSEPSVAKERPPFNRIMTGVHRAIDLEQWEEASSLLDEALQLEPSSAAAQDLRDFVATQLERVNQRDLSERFTTAVHAERWIEANELAAKLNTQDSAVIEQMQRSEALITIEKLTDRLLSSPERLSRPSTQNEVGHLRNLHEKVDPGKRVGDKLAALNELNRRWTTPVIVNIDSDGYTTVILRPGRSLGRFRSQKIQLMPGNYELIGRRDGYREVRTPLLLHPNSQIKTVEIEASERF